MTITATKGFSKAVFTWNDDFTECSHVAIDISDEVFETLIENNVHEGCDFEDWNVEIKM